ncbi:MAG: SIS domain-containing protein, partial [Bryobacteraceae bacterium]
MLTSASTLASRAEEALLRRNAPFEKFFRHESMRLAAACRDMSDRFLQGGRLLAFGRGAYATDAQHVSVEFVHPVIVGKRALPALDLSLIFSPALEVLLRPEDIVMGFGPPEGDAEVEAALQRATTRGAMTFALPGSTGSYFFHSPNADPFLHQEMIEILYHTLWETVHVFFERRVLGHDVGDAGFLYPYLGQEKQETTGVLDEVAASIVMKVEDDTRLRKSVSEEQSEAIAQAVIAIHERVSRGGKLILFGNGGSATDANDFAIDCMLPPQGYRPIPAISLSLEPANITALANDVGTEVIFLRQMIAQARPEDVAVGISTSGGSKNIIMALEEARKRGMLTVALLGYDGGEILRRGLADHPLIVRSDYIPRIQEVQASIYH